MSVGQHQQYVSNMETGEQYATIVSITYGDLWKIDYLFNEPSNFLVYY